MIAENQIRGSVARYLRGEISLDQLEDWLVEQSWNMHRDSDESAQRLAGAIELRLAEHSSGHMDELSLQRELLSLINKTLSLISLGGLPGYVASSNNVVIQGEVIQLAVPARQVLLPQGADVPAGT